MICSDGMVCVQKSRPQHTQNTQVFSFARGAQSAPPRAHATRQSRISPQVSHVACARRMSSHFAKILMELASHARTREFHLSLCLRHHVQSPEVSPSPEDEVVKQWRRRRHRRTHGLPSVNCCERVVINMVGQSLDVALTTASGGLYLLVSLYAMFVASSPNVLSMCFGVKMVDQDTGKPTHGLTMLMYYFLGPLTACFLLPCCACFGDAEDQLCIEKCLGIRMVKWGER